MKFDYKNLLEIRKMDIEELNHYYRMLRKYEYDNNVQLDSSKLKKKIHGLAKAILRIDRIITGRKLVIYDDKRDNNVDGGKIYAVSHVGRYDVESVLEAIDEQAYIVMGDPGESYRDFDGWFLDTFYGRVKVDTGYQEFDNLMKLKEGKQVSKKDRDLINEYKTDRHICEETCVKRIKNKDNILIFPEGAWNITEKLTQPLFTGTARIAIKGMGTIIPVGIVRDDKKYTVNIGKSLDISGASIEDAQDITDKLKEEINSLKGEIIFSNEEPQLHRSMMGTPEENKQAFIDDIMKETTNDYTQYVIEKSRFYDKNAPENVYKTLRK